MARDEDRGVRDQAGIGPDPALRSEHVVAMRDMENFRIAEGEPDVRGWEVYSSSGTFIGDVHDLLIDPELHQVVMIEIDMKDAERHGRAPMKAAWLDRDRKRVIIDSAQLDRELLEHRAQRATTTETEVTRVDDDTIIIDETRRRGPLVDPAAEDRRGEERL